MTLWFKPKHKVVARIYKIVRRYCARAHTENGQYSGTTRLNGRCWGPDWADRQRVLHEFTAFHRSNVPPEEWEELHEGASETAVLLPGPAAPPPSNGGDRDITDQMDARVRSKFNPAQKMVPSDKAP
jgi:hypothetical protein